MRFPAMLLVSAALCLGGCGELSRRTISDEDVPLTTATVEALAGDYQVMVHGGRTFHPPSSTYYLIGELESSGKKPGTLPAVLSLRFSQGKVHINLKAQGKDGLQICDYEIAENEVRLENVHDGFNAVILASEIKRSAAFGRFKDGRLWMRCRSTGFFLILVIIPIIVNEELTVVFSPVPLAKNPPASD